MGSVLLEMGSSSQEGSGFVVGPVLGVLSCHPCLVPEALSACGGLKTWLFAILQHL